MPMGNDDDLSQIMQMGPFYVGSYVYMMWNWWTVRTKHEYIATIFVTLIAAFLRRYLDHISRVAAGRVDAALARGRAATASEMAHKADDYSHQPLVYSNGGVPSDRRTSGAGRPSIAANNDDEDVVRTSWGFAACPCRWPRGMTGGAVWDGFIATAAHALAYTLAFLLMLAAMTYNVGVFVAVMVGEAVAFAVFSSGLFIPGRAGSGDPSCCAS